MRKNILVKQQDDNEHVHCEGTVSFNYYLFASFSFFLSFHIRIGTDRF